MSLEIAKGESLEWLNSIVEFLWPRINKAVQKIVQEQVVPQVQEKLPGPLQSVKINVNLGDETPAFGPIKVYTLKDAAGKETGLKMHLRVDYTSDVNVQISIGPMSVGVRSLRFVGELVVKMSPLIDEVPVVGGLTVYFLNPPDIDMDFTGLGNILDAPGLAGILRSAVDSVIAGVVVMPNQIAVPIGTEDQGVDRAKLKMPIPLGLLRVTAVRGSHLPGTDWHLFSKASADPYVVVKLGAETWMSPHCDQTTDPVWPDDTFSDLLVFDREQLIRIQVWDKDIGPDDFMGKAQTLMVGNVVMSPGQRDLPLYAQKVDVDVEGDVQATKCGDLTLSFEFLEPVPGKIPDACDICLLTVKADEVIVPSACGQDVGVTVKVSAPAVSGSGEGFSTEASMPLGSVPKPKAAGKAVSQVLESVITKLNEKGMPKEDIAEVVALPCSEVTKVLGGGEVQVDLASDSAPHVVEVEACITLKVPKAYLDSADIELVLADKKKAVICMHKARLSDVKSAQGLTLPGPIKIPSEKGEVEAQIEMSLAGTQKKSR